MLGQPISMLIPRVVGFRLTGQLPARHHRHRPGPHDHRDAAQARRGRQVRRVLRRRRGQVPVANRATIGNMSPEFGSTCAIFPIDAATIEYLRLTGRPEAQLDLVEKYAKAQGLWHDPSQELRFSEELTLDLSTVVPSHRRPKRPQDKIELSQRQDRLPGRPPGLHRRRRQRHASPPPTPASSEDVRRHPRGQGHPRRRQRDDPRPRPRRHRRDHLLHQHLQPVRDDRRRAAGEEGGREGPEPQALGEDHPRPRLEGRHGLLRARRAHPVPGQARIQPRRLRLHHLHRQLRPAADRRSARPSTRTTSPSSASCPATATSRAGSTRTSR